MRRHSPPRQVTPTLLGGHGDDDYDDDVRWEEQDMPYLPRDRRRAEGGEGEVNKGVDDKLVVERVGSTSGGYREWAMAEIAA